LYFLDFFINFIIGTSNPYFSKCFHFQINCKRLYLSYAGIVIFSLYLVFDFNRLEKAVSRGDESWKTTIDIAINLYLDIINLFIDFLEGYTQNA